MKECHDSPWAGHPGMRRSLALLERGFFWEKMREDVEEYVYVLHLSAGQIGYSETRRTVAAFTDSREAMNECLDGLHHLVATG